MTWAGEYPNCHTGLGCWMNFGIAGGATAFLPVIDVDRRMSKNNTLTTSRSSFANIDLDDLSSMLAVGERVLISLRDNGSLLGSAMTIETRGTTSHPVTDANLAVIFTDTIPVGGSLETEHVWNWPYLQWRIINNDGAVAANVTGCVRVIPA